MSPEEAKAYGLVDEVVAAEELDSAVRRKVDAILQSGPNALAATKHLIRQIAGMTPDEAANTTIECIADARVSPEGQEGVQAFLDKRKAKFSEG